MIIPQYINGNVVPNNELDISLLQDTSETVFRELFEIYKEKMVIIEGEYESDVWKLTDRDDDGRIHFERIKHIPNNYSYKRYINAIKNYVLGSLHKKRHFAGIVKFANSYIDWNEATDGFKRPIRTKVISPDKEKLDLLAEELEIDIICDNVVTLSGTSGNRRDLLDIEEYFWFDNQLRITWPVLSDSQKEVFFPLWSFWNICNIIPDRPKEFRVTPLECLQELKGQYYINLRKSDIKGSKRYVDNNVDNYPLVSFPIPNHIAMEIEWFLERRRYYKVSDPIAQNRLFTNTFRNEYFGIKSEREVFRGEDMEFLKKKFYALLGEMYNFNPEEKEIWRSGDLRHLALINMIDQGVDPRICMIFAGHCDMTMVLHYGENINKMTRLRINHVEKYLKPPKSFRSESGIINLGNAKPLMNNGFCRNDYGRWNEWPCENYPDCKGCEHFYALGLVKELENQRVELIRHFVKLYYRNEYNELERIIRNIQELGAILEGEYYGEKKEI